ncbi:MAG: hypothetical protein JWO92_640 [Chitinophagaceae bacterium]|nr:hypothetical protein [Chitinophagaceae bacterium]MDB5224108.1 hypothetical protein [Chitinophagaceae bacterium]
MNVWLKSLRISIAGAKLSHLVQKDKVWDHGSMVEQVRTVAILLKKAFHRNDAEVVKKCITETAFKKMKEQIETAGANTNQPLMHDELEEVSIIAVAPGKKGQQDRFTASVKFKRREQQSNISFSTINVDYSTKQVWQFVRQREWWLLDDIKVKKILQHF